MTLPNASEITSYYLYGAKTPPSNLVDEKLVRPTTDTSEIKVDMNEFMQSGAGRFDNPSMLSIVKKFFNSNDSSFLANGEEKRFSISELAQELGIANAEKASRATYQQRNFRDGNDDLIERTYIYNSSVFHLSQDAIFVVDKDGNRSIENFSLIHERDNFDFESSDTVASVGNKILATNVDPSGIGRTVYIDFTGNTPPYNYSIDDYNRDVLLYNNNRVPTGAVGLLFPMLELTSKMWDNGTTRFMDGDRPLFYGTNGDDVQSGYKPSSFQSEFMGNGITYLAGGGDDKAFGTKGNDKIIGGAGNDGLNGREGNDELYGDGLEDAASGGADQLYGGEGADKLFGGAGDDKLFGGSGDDILYGEFKTSVLAHGNDELNGGVGNDILYGDSERYSSLDGNDTLNGNAGDDILYGGGGNDILNGGADNDVLYGDLLNPLEGGNDQLLGGAGGDQLFGGAGDDVLSGGVGSDKLVGGFGNDQLTGGGGADVFVFGDQSLPDNAGMKFGNDTVTDFNLGQGDKLDFSAFGHLNTERTVWSQNYVETDAGYQMLFYESPMGASYYARITHAGQEMGTIILQGASGDLSSNWFIFA